MKVYIVRAGYDYCDLSDINVFNSVKKAKNFCKNEYGVKLVDWTYDKASKRYFYDPSKERELKKLWYTDFKIDVRDVL